MLFKKKIIIVTLLMILSVVTMARPDNYANGIGAADEIKVTIVAVATTSNQNMVDFTEAKYERIVAMGTNGPVDGNDVKVYVLIEYGTDITLADNENHSLYIYNPTPNSSIETMLELPTLIFNDTVVLNNGLNMNRRLLRFSWNTGSPSMTGYCCLDSEIMYSYVGYDEDYFVDGYANTKVIINPLTEKEREDIINDRIDKLKIVICTPGNAHDYNLADTYDYAEAIKPFTDSFINLNILSYPIVDGFYLSNNTLVIDSSSYELMELTNDTINTHGGGAREDAGNKTYYISVRSKLDEEYWDEDDFAFSTTGSDFGFLPIPRQILLNKESIDSLADDFCKYMIKKYEGNGEIFNDAVNCRKILYTNTLAHEIGHALGESNECYSFIDCVMFYTAEEENKYSSFPSVGNSNNHGCKDIHKMYMYNVLGIYRIAD